jgi:hypothetical protein
MKLKSLLWCTRVAPCSVVGVDRRFRGHQGDDIHDFYFFLWIYCGLYYYRKSSGIKRWPPAEPHAGVRHAYGGVLPGVLKGSFATLLSPPQCHAAFGTMPHTLATKDQSPVWRPRTLPPSTTRTHRARFWSGSTGELYFVLASWTAQKIHLHVRNIRNYHKYFVTIFRKTVL